MSRPRAANMIRPGPEYRRQQFEAGLEEAGFTLVDPPYKLTDPKPGDLLVTWNLIGAMQGEAARFRQAGATVIVAENGYLGAELNHHNKPFDSEGRQLYALALDRHAGAGNWPVGDASRWVSQGIGVYPWRTDGEHLLVLGQRGIGEPGVAAPRGWAELATQTLKHHTSRPVRIRPHPGREPEKARPLLEDLEGCWAVVVWSSNAGLQALCRGYPMICDFSKWIGFHAGKSMLHIETPCLDDLRREEVLTRVAWAQYSIDEIASGWPFKWLLSYRKLHPYLCE